ncbi:MAG: CHAD domain-containing protein, partial [Solirubrobacterales bacterium]|nr:CHAD domain-containing protein [Solirubrobacterales bacterium]
MSGSDLLLPDQMTLPSAGEALASALEIRASAQREYDRVYYDTFDGLLHAAGLSLVHEDGHLSLVNRETGLAQAALAVARPGRPLFATELTPGPLREALQDLADVRALLLLVHLRSHVRPMSVLDGEQKTVVRLALEEAVVAGPAAAGSRLRPRLRITAVRGYDKARRDVQATLVENLAFKPAEETLVDEAVRVAGGVPGGFRTKIELPLRSEERADTAAAAVLRTLLEVIEANVDGTVADLDSEFLHDFRVSVRRTRAVQRELGA